MILRFGLFALFYLILFPTIACLNGETLVLLNHDIYIDDEDNIPSGHTIIADLNEVYHELDSLYTKTHNLNYLSDIGYIYIFQGRYHEAIQLYLSIEQKRPGKYSTASNLGTAYELLGNNIEALKWLERAVKISPKSHFESEWIHINIIKAKLSDKHHYTSKLLINTDFGDKNTPQTSLSQKALSKLQSAIYYQLNERITFIKDRDPIIARLFFDLGNIHALNIQLDDAFTLYEEAKKYGFRDEIIERRVNKLNGIQFKLQKIKSAIL